MEPKELAGKTPTRKTNTPNRVDELTKELETEKERAKAKKPMTDERFGSFIRLMVLTWSGGLLTLYYLGGLQRLDTTFIGGLLTQTLAAFGITLGSTKKEEKNAPEGLEGQQPMKAPKVK